MKAKIFSFEEEKQRRRGAGQEPLQARASGREEGGYVTEEIEEKQKLQAERSMYATWDTFSNVVTPLVRRLRGSNEMHIPAEMLGTFRAWESEYYKHLAEVDALSPDYVHASVREAYRQSLLELEEIFRTNIPSGRQLKALKWVEKWGLGFGIKL